MKTKLVLFGIIVLGLLAVVGCGNAGEQNSDQVATEPVQVPESLPVEEVSAAQRLADANSMAAARAAHDLALCKEIKTKSVKQDCVDTITYDLVKANELDNCKAISNKDLREQCEGTLEQQADARRDLELSGKAQANSDPTQCSEITGEDLKVSCYTKVAISKADPAICEAISQPELKADCIDLASTDQ